MKWFSVIQESPTEVFVNSAFNVLKAATISCDLVRFFAFCKLWFFVALFL